jgi:hypothetical protein
MTIAILAMSCTSEKANNIEDARIIYELKGAVKSVVCETYDIVDIMSGEIIKGDKSESPSFNPLSDNSLGDNSIFSFNVLGEIENLTKFSPDGKIIYGMTNKFNKDNQIIESEISHNSTKSRTLFERDKMGNPIKSKTLDFENKLICESILKLDDSNRIIEGSSSYPADNKSYLSKFEYTDNLKIQSIYDEKGSLILMLKKNNKGKFIEKISYEKEKIAALYDNNDFLITYTVFDESELSRSFKYLNDEKGNIIDAKIYSNGDLDVSYKFEYEYDENSNWIKRVMFENDNPISVTTRSIEYS